MLARGPPAQLISVSDASVVATTAATSPLNAGPSRFLIPVRFKPSSFSRAHLTSAAAAAAAPGGSGAFVMDSLFKPAYRR